MIATAIRAIFENGILKPAEKLPLNEHQQVLVVVVPLTSTVEYNPDAARVAKMREQAQEWLRQQPANAVREPVTLASATEQRLDDEFESALAAIRARADRFNEAQILADVEQAVAHARELSDAERVQLDAECAQVLADIAAHAIAP